ncbi:translesion error-prone DNA polymerase V subunit UmuC [Venatoribacter cucullus]|uniref:translesion error-prone DNA polymerase V subunit UmuC n=1 Tax=Venatoribacter cucullus TaxID=2661630 RepID=UPI00223EB336|nr:translesion error-prone DNA polymerase V subunit UmuC [Venatoribacter cucullus]UZK03875.1 translesion error-prone DNA polymerase V subunit UmuC [Venatoribacter cucullus]
MRPVFALVDCNNFYASCEKLFRPDLRHTPVVVLSNNDGCVVARSKEAKALGIKMGVPVHKIQEQIQQHGVQVFSSNYALYGDISNRVMQTLEALAPAVEVYSIDEAFLDLTGVANAVDLTEFGLQVRATIQQHIGMTVCVGIAPTKTLAKLANHAAKQYPATRGVVDLTDPIRQKKLLSLMPVSEVWGVGRKLSERLNAMGITTALALAEQNPKDIRQKFSVVLERTVRELNGESCLALEDITPTKQQILCSRSFGQRVTRYTDMHEAISSYVARAAEKLRYEKQQCRLISVYVRTGLFNPNEPHYSNSAAMKLEYPTDDTRVLLEAAGRLLQAIWKDGYRYAKAGITLSDFYDRGVVQPDLFTQQVISPNSTKLMQVLDRINQQQRGRVFFASQGTGKAWAMNRNHLSPSYTTDWKQLRKV